MIENSRLCTALAGEMAIWFDRNGCNLKENISKYIFKDIFNGLVTEKFNFFNILISKFSNIITGNC